MVKRYKRLNNQPEIWLNNTRSELEGCGGIGGAAPGDTLNKALKTLVSITFYISEDVRTRFSVINLTYSPLFWDTGLQGVSLVYQQRRI